MSFKNKTRTSYTVAFKLKVIEHAMESNNCVAARGFGVNEKLVRDWPKLADKLQEQPRSKRALRFQPASFAEMEKDLNDWVLECRQNGYIVTRSSIRI